MLRTIFHFLRVPWAGVQCKLPMPAAGRKSDGRGPDPARGLKVACPWSKSILDFMSYFQAILIFLILWCKTKHSENMRWQFERGCHFHRFDFFICNLLENATFYDFSAVRFLGATWRDMTSLKRH